VKNSEEYRSLGAATGGTAVGRGWPVGSAEEVELRTWRRRRRGKGRQRWQSHEVEEGISRLHVIPVRFIFHFIPLFFEIANLYLCAWQSSDFYHFSEYPCLRIICTVDPKVKLKIWCFRKDYSNFHVTLKLK
jgi:hypothetical protein